MKILSINQNEQRDNRLICTESISLSIWQKNEWMFDDDGSSGGGPEELFPFQFLQEAKQSKKSFFF